ncbi:hypothetical protein G3570_10760 [Balneolaceae bacterium YR4-1]|uniref:Uncharacterized protein n=1 Tax=Halalkalibaculum roseum TaxID=2709311 RepID=A0A6M1SYV2_9BACT|nr:hypothetical protein [Halalkalibaculum roseum]NGP77116.1 hypothetical protein [Halalkalibaculum roseum]
MVKHEARGTDQLFMETKMGIVTRSGEWFHITSDLIEEYVPGLLDEVSLHDLIKEARAWVRSSDSLSLTLLLGMILYLNPWVAAIATLAFHWLWYNYKSALANRWLGKVFSIMNGDGYQMIIALVVLSLLGMWGQYLALGIGITFFFILRLSLLNKLWEKLTSNKEVTLNDRMLKMLIVRYAMSENLAPQEVQNMEEELADAAMKIKNKRK